MIVFGTRMFGQTDRVPGVFYVATRFFHINFIPICPLGSFLVIEASPPRGIAIPLSPESLISAWLRALAWIVALVFSALTIAYLPFDNSGSVTRRRIHCQHFVIFLVGSLLLIAIAMFLQCHAHFQNASYERATEICSTFLPDHVGISKLVDQHFGRDVVVIASCAMLVSSSIGDQDDDDDHMELAIASAANNNNNNDTSARYSDRGHWVHAEHREHFRRASDKKGSLRKPQSLPIATVLEVMV